MREADALCEAGFSVCVVAANVNAQLRSLDESLLPRVRWRHLGVTRGPAAIYALRTVAQRAARSLLGWFGLHSLRIARIAHHRLITRISATACRVRADLYIAHNLAALPSAARAAERWRAKLGFDAEDFHSEEVSVKDRDAGDQRAREIIQECLLGRCEHLTAGSPLIAQAYQRAYGVAMTPLLNVFPLRDDPERKNSPNVEPCHRSLYWFSQTIGEGRGLEAIVLAMALMRQPPQLFLRGNADRAFKGRLLSMARDSAIETHINFLPPAGPDEMVALAARYSAGLAVERNEPQNRAICLTNKAFAYLLAGIPVVLSRTPAQEQLAEQLGEAALLVDLRNPASVAEALSALLDDSRRLKRAADHAKRLGRERFNWDCEKEIFLRLVSTALSTTVTPRTHPFA